MPPQKALMPVSRSLCPGRRCSLSVLFLQRCSMAMVSLLVGREPPKPVIEPQSQASPRVPGSEARKAPRSRQTRMSAHKPDG